MPVLRNSRQERFAQELAKGKSATEAYVIAGYKHNRGNANELKSKEHISKRVSELLIARDEIAQIPTKKAMERLSLTKEWVIASLMENAQRALQAIPVTDREGNPTGEYKYEGSVANRALELLGKEMGMFIDRKEQGAPGEFAELDAGSIRQAIAERLGLAGPGDEKASVSRREGSGGEQPLRVHSPSLARH